MKRTVRQRIVAGVALVAVLATAAVVGAAYADGRDSDRVAVTATTPRLVVDASRVRSRLPVRQGVQINKWYDNAEGLWADGATHPDARDKIRRTGVGMIRFPGGTSANLYRWKRALGTRRLCQTDGKTLRRRTDNAYGPAEFMKLADETGATPQVMVPFANGSPKDAADWVEYFNAPRDTNPNGGIAWARWRPAEHPEPYRVTRFEIGNEQDRAGIQRYWMSQDPVKAMNQYIRGAERDFVDQPLGRDCDFTGANRRSNGRPGQNFYLRYGLVKPGTAPTVKVGGVTWRRVADLSQAGPDARVYTLHRKLGRVTFGDGTHGAIPPDGKPVTVSYTFKHRGFARMYEAMKAVAERHGPPITVCATWARMSKRGTPADRIGKPSFPARMKARGEADKYDCLSTHPYTNFKRDFGTAWEKPAEGHHQHMLGEAWMRRMLRHHSEDLAAHSAAGDDGRKAYLAVSEMGALWFGSDPMARRSREAFPSHSATMTHCVYLVSQFVHLANLDARWVLANDMTGGRKGLRGMLGGVDTGFVYGAEARTRQALRPAFAEGSAWLGGKVEDQPYVSVDGLGRWAVLRVGASKGRDGKLRIVVVNRRMFHVQAARVVPRGFAHTSRIAVTTVAGESFTSYHDGQPGGDDSVRVERSTRTVAGGVFRHTFRPHSVTVLTLTPSG